MADRDADGIYHVAYNDNPERTLAMLEKVNVIIILIEKGFVNSF